MKIDEIIKLIETVSKNDVDTLNYATDSEKIVNVGDRVKKGQVIGIIEAMKLMNELESDFDGVVKEILVKDEDVVEFGQPLFILE